MTPDELRNLSRKISEMADSLRAKEARILGCLSDLDIGYMDGISDAVFLLLTRAREMERDAKKAA